MQYRETDFNFVSRLMEEEGIYFFFKHDDGRHTAVVADSYSAHQTFEGYAEIPFIQVERTSRIEQEYIHEWYFAREVQAGRYVLDDFDFEKPSVDLEVKTNQKRSHEQADHEVYDYPGGYLTAGDGNQIVRARLEELQARFELANGSTNARGVCVGSLFKLTGQPRSDQNREYLVLSAEYELEYSEYEAMESAGYELRLPVPGAREQDAVPARSASRRSRSSTARRRRSSSVPSGEEIYTDKYGRVKVQFHWDRVRQEGREQLVLDPRLAPLGGQELGRGRRSRASARRSSSTSSKAIPTVRSSSAASTTPSRCRRTSCRRTRRRRGIKIALAARAAAANFNEIRFEDKKGEEQVYIHAEKNQDNIVENDETTDVGHDRTENVDNNEKITIGVDRTENVGNNETIAIGVNRTETVGANETHHGGQQTATITVGASETKTVALQRTHTVGVNETIAIGAAQEIAIGAFQAVAIGAYQTVNVGANQSTDVGANQSTNVGSNRSIDVGSNLSTNVGGDESRSVTGARSTSIGKDDSLKVGKNLVVDAGDSVTIKTGSASITMKKDGTIVIKGKDITVEGSGNDQRQGVERHRDEGFEDLAELRDAMNDRVEITPAEAAEDDGGADSLRQLLDAPVEVREPAAGPARIDGVLVGTLVGMRGPHEPLVVYPGQRGTAAIVARTTMDLHGIHIGGEVTLMFEAGDRLASDRNGLPARARGLAARQRARPGGSRRGRRADDPQCEGAARPALWQGDDHAHEGREGSDPGYVSVEPLVGGESH